MSSRLRFNPWKSRFEPYSIFKYVVSLNKEVWWRYEATGTVLVRYLNFTLLIVVCAVTASAAEMPLPFSSQQFESQLSATTTPDLLEQFDQIRAFDQLANPVDNEIDSDVFGARSLGRFLKKPTGNVAPLGTDFPTDCMQDPELDQVPPQPSLAVQSQPPGLNTDAVPPAVIGHGMGVEYGFFDIIFDFTRRKAFVHNGYMALWFKFGLWGLGLMVFVWVRSAWRGAQVFRLAHADRLYKMAGLGVSISLAAFMLSSITANPFFLNDTTYLFGLLMGLAGGLYQRALVEQPTLEANHAV
jgi:hypothetical protein